MSPSPKFTTSQVSNKVPAIAKWFGIIGLLFFSISSNISNDTMSSIPYELSDYFGIKVGMINATYVSAKFLNFLVAPLAIFIIDYLGPTVTIYASLISSIIVILFRVISFSVGGLAGYIIFFASELFVAIQMTTANCSYLIYISIWFPEKLRMIANAIYLFGSILGLVLAMNIGPLFIGAGAVKGDFLVFTFVNGGFSVIGIIFCLALFLSNSGNRFSVMPSEGYAMHSFSSLEIVRKYRHQNRSAGEAFHNIYNELKSILNITDSKTRKGFPLLWLSFAQCFGIGGIALSGTPQMLCIRNYPKIVATGLCMISLIVSGMIFAVIVSYFNNKYSNGVFLIKVLLVIASIGGWLTYISTQLINVQNNFFQYEIFLMVSYLLFGAGIAVLPLASELSIECTYPKGQGLINGIFDIGTNLGQFIYGVLFYSIPREVTDQKILDENQCNLSESSESTVLDFTTPLLILVICYSIGALLPIFFLEVPYLRKKADDQAKCEKNSAFVVS